MNITVPPVQQAFFNKDKTMNVAWQNHFNQHAQQLRYAFGSDSNLLPVVWNVKLQKLQVNLNGTWTDVG